MTPPTTDPSPPTTRTSAHGGVRHVGVASILIFVGLSAVAIGVHAKVYRCGPNGTIAQDTPCPVVQAPPAPPPKLSCALDDATRLQAARREDQFLKRYPDAAAHGRARRADLQPAIDGIRQTQEQLNARLAERVPIAKELDFYVDKPPPAALKAKADANDARLLALVELFRGHEQTIRVVTLRYDCERATYGKLWSGAAPGSSACDPPTCASP